MSNREKVSSSFSSSSSSSSSFIRHLPLLILVFFFSTKGTYRATGAVGACGPGTNRINKVSSYIFLLLFIQYYFFLLLFLEAVPLDVHFAYLHNDRCQNQGMCGPGKGG